MSRQRKSLAAFEDAPLSGGYENDVSFVWSYTDQHGFGKVVSFENFHDDLGPVVVALVTAGIRLSKSYGSARSIGQAIGSLRAFCKYLSRSGWLSTSTVRDFRAEILLDFVRSFPNQDTGASYAGYVKNIISEALRREKLHIAWPRVSRPSQTADTQKLPANELEPDDVKAIIAAARSDVVQIWRDFERAREASPGSLMYEVRQIAIDNAGILPQINGGELTDAQRRLRALRSKERHAKNTPSTMLWHRWLYATNYSIVPFLILIIYGLAGNVISVIEAPRTLLAYREDVFRGSRAVVSFLKKRSRRVLSHGFKDGGAFSVPSLLRKVLAMTEPLVEHVGREQRERLFITYRIHGARRGLNHGAVSPINESDMAQSLEDFVERHKLLNKDGERLCLMFDNLRPARIQEIFSKTGDIFAARAVANHRLIRTTFPYLKARHVFRDSQIAIADQQAEFFSRSASIDEAMPELAGVSTEPARAVERDCADPFAAPGKPAGELCPEWNATLTNPNLVIPPDPNFIAAILRDRDAYAASLYFIDARRYEQLYAPKVALLDHILGTFANDQALMNEARVIQKTLVPGPEIR